MQDTAMLLYVSGLHFLKNYCYNPFAVYGDTITCLAILRLMDIWIHCLAIMNKDA